jgi:hypothetical protein
MATRITNWGPSHCNCTLRYTWDDQDPEFNRKHTFMAFLVKCDKHKHLPETQESFQEIIRENQEFSRKRAEEDANG